MDGTAKDASKPISVASDKPLVLSGKTVPNGIVTLTVHSTPKTVTITADKNGNWSYMVSGLKPGSHYVEASVKDPATGQTSPTAKLLSFTVTAAKSSAAATKIASTATHTKKSHTAVYLLILLLVVILSGGSWYGWKWRQKKSGSKVTLPPTPPEQSAPTT